MPTTAQVTCSHGKESVKTLEFSGVGKHEISITRTTAITEHVQGIVSIKGPAGQKRFRSAYRSDFGGFRHTITLSDAGSYELKVTGSAQSMVSDLFGCDDSGILINIQLQGSPSASGQFVVGFHKGSTIKWQVFPTLQDARKTYDVALWSKALFSPSGYLLDSSSGPLDMSGRGVAAIQRSYGTQYAGRRSELSFSLMETSQGLASEYAGGIDEALTRSQSDLTECLRCVNNINYGSGRGSASISEKDSKSSDDYILDFVAANLEELVQLLEQGLAAANIDKVQADRIMIIDSAGSVMNDFPENEDRFPLRIRYAREKLPKPEEDLNLLEHEQLMHHLYASEGLDMVALQDKARHLMRTFGLRAHDMGARNLDERGNPIYNQCFYLSLARGLLGHQASTLQIQEIALKLKRSIEAAVIAQRPQWKREVSEEAQAFADFLPMAMRGSENANESNFLAELAVCIIDSSTCHVEAYLGPMYKRLSDAQTQQRNLIVLWYTPGHYKCVVNNDRHGSKVMMTYKDFKDLLVSQNVTVIETLE